VVAGTALPVHSLIICAERYRDRQAAFGGRPDRELLLHTEKKDQGRWNSLPNQLLGTVHSQQDRSALSLCPSAHRL
jgi:hypothetical protein